MGRGDVCGSKLSGHHLTNLRRHMTAKHADVFNSISEEINDTELPKDVKKRKIAYEANEEDVTSSIVKIVTSDGRPIELLDSEGFREILRPIFNALEMPPITSEKIMDHVRERELSIKRVITSSVDRKLVSLKLDVATRMEKSVLGIHLQFINSTLTATEVVVKTLGIIQLSENLSGLDLKNQIVKTIENYGIQMDQIYSITADNGKNMMTAIELLNEDVTEECLNDEENVEHLMELLDSTTFPNVQLQRCAAHTLHSCVHDLNRRSEIFQKITNCRQMCKVLRTAKYRRILMQKNLPIPPLDVPARWNSSYTMLVGLFELKEFLTSQIDVNFKIDWTWVEVYIEAFKETHEATLMLEREHFSYSDFFILWMELKLKAEKSQNYIMKEFLAHLKFREKQLLENKAILAAIYMDPRINLILSEQQKHMAKIHLKEIASRILSSNETTKQQVIKSEISMADDKDKSLLDTFLDGIQAVPQTQDVKISEKLAKVYGEIENFTIVPRLPLNSDIKKFYHDLKFKSPIMVKLVQVVLAAPASQATVVRSFSALKCIINDRKTLTPENMNSLLVVRLNS